MDIFKNTAKKKKKIKRGDQILPEVYGTTLNEGRMKYVLFPDHRLSFSPLSFCHCIVCLFSIYC